MADDYMILESKMNNLSLSELNNLESGFENILFNKLDEIKSRSNLAYHSAINKIGKVLLQSSHEKPLEAFNLPRGVFYDSYKQYYVLQTYVNKKRKVLKRSSDFHVIMQAYKDFHNEKSRAKKTP